MIKRTAYQHLLKWKKNGGKTALMIEGARRVGKSTLVKEFAKNEYTSHILVDFSKAPKEVKDLFLDKRDDIDSFLLYLSSHYDVKLVERDSLLIFDEVQLLPEARGFLKHLVADGRYDYIATGSLISIKENIKDILIPSEESSFELNPLSFAEFLEAIGSEPLAELLPSVLESQNPLPEALHRKAMSLFREYMLVGGMPQAVQAYIETRDFAIADEVKREILSTYQKDIVRYARSERSRVTAIFNQIPSQLSKREKRFVLSHISTNARMRRYEDAFFWLQDAKMVNLSYNATDPNVGLSLNLDYSSLKCFMADTGLLVTQSFSDKIVTPHELYKAILFDRLGINEGMLTENIVAQCLHNSGHNLFFYSRNDRANSAEAIEVDFLVQRQFGSRYKICPIEVKSSKRFKTASLDKFTTKFNKKIGKQYILYTGNLEIVDERVLTPLYLAPWL